MDYGTELGPRGTQAQTKDAGGGQPTGVDIPRS